jgi:hypothetical protein
MEREFRVAGTYIGIVDYVEWPRSVINGVANVLTVVWSLVAFLNVAAATSRPVRPLRSTILLNVSLVSLLFMIGILKRLWSESVKVQGILDSVSVGALLVIVAAWLCDAVATASAFMHLALRYLIHGAGYTEYYYALDVTEYAASVIGNFVWMAIVINLTRAQMAWASPLDLTGAETEE